MKKEAGFEDLVRFILPEGVLDYFEIRDVIIAGNTVNVHLEEHNIVPEGYEKERLLSNGFHDPVCIQDFPIRKKAMYLHVKRRRWLVESSGKSISRDWNMVTSGTRFTKEFATFLKGAFGLTTN